MAYQQKIGIDFHGVIDVDPDFFSFLSSTVIAAGGEVHIITGQRDGKDLRDALNRHGISYTHLFSILTYHEEQKTPIWFDEDRHPWMNDKMWDRTKGEYCARMGINVHFDDTERYAEYFPPTTSFILHKGKTNE